MSYNLSYINTENQVSKDQCWILYTVWNWHGTSTNGYVQNLISGEKRENIGINRYNAECHTIFPLEWYEIDMVLAPMGT